MRQNEDRLFGSESWFLFELFYNIKKWNCSSVPRVATMIKLYIKYRVDIICRAGQNILLTKYNKHIIKKLIFSKTLMFIVNFWKNLSLTQVNDIAQGKSTFLAYISRSILITTKNKAQRKQDPSVRKGLLCSILGCEGLLIYKIKKNISFATVQRKWKKQFYIYCINILLGLNHYEYVKYLNISHWKKKT